MLLGEIFGVLFFLKSKFSFFLTQRMRNISFVAYYTEQLIFLQAKSQSVEEMLWSTETSFPSPASSYSRFLKTWKAPACCESCLFPCAPTLPLLLRKKRPSNSPRSGVAGCLPFTYYALYFVLKPKRDHVSCPQDNKNYRPSGPDHQPSPQASSWAGSVQLPRTYHYPATGSSRSRFRA